MSYFLIASLGPLIPFLVILSLSFVGSSRTSNDVPPRTNQGDLPSAKCAQLSELVAYKPAMGQNIALHALSTVRIIALNSY